MTLEKIARADYNYPLCTSWLPPIVSLLTIRVASSPAGLGSSNNTRLFTPTSVTLLFPMSIVLLVGQYTLFYIASSISISSMSVSVNSPVSVTILIQSSVPELSKRFFYICSYTFLYTLLFFRK